MTPVRLRPAARNGIALTPSHPDADLGEEGVVVDDGQCGWFAGLLVGFFWCEEPGGNERLQHWPSVCPGEQCGLHWVGFDPGLDHRPTDGGVMPMASAMCALGAPPLGSCTYAHQSTGSTLARGVAMWPILPPYARTQRV